MGLAGKTILITRAEHQASAFAESVKKAGGIPVLFPTIRILPPSSWEECDAAIGQIDRYNSLIFTSGNAVESFFGRLKHLHVQPTRLANKSVFAVGEKTEQLLGGQGLQVDFIPEKFTAEGLAASLTSEQVSGKRFLFPRGNLGKDILKQHIEALGGVIDSVVVYRTEPPDQNNVAHVAGLLRDRAVDVVTFTSPSTVRNFFASITELPSDGSYPLYAAIGPVTAAAMERSGRTAHIEATESTTEGLLEAISHYFEQHQS